MDGRIDPPASMHRLTEGGVLRQTEAGGVRGVGPAEAPLACVFHTPKPGALCLGKRAVATAARRQGPARHLVALAKARARAPGLGALELQTRVQRANDPAAFARLGGTAHPGCDRITSSTLRKPVSRSGRG